MDFGQIREKMSGREVYERNKIMLDTIRDRDYILDDDGNYLKVVGDFHPDEKIISYIKYFPSKFGNRVIQHKRYGYNSFVSKSFVVLFGKNERVCFSRYHGGILTCTPMSQIRQRFSCRDKIQQILSQPEKYKAHPVGEELIDFLLNVNKHVDLINVGITGSFLIDCYNNTSDIDLVCYGKESYKTMKDAFAENVLSYSGSEHEYDLYHRRMIHMAPMNFDLLIKQESRKIQGLTKKKHIHINCQPLRGEEDRNFFKNLAITEIGEMSCIAEITDDCDGIYSPAYYGIRVIDVVNSLFSGVGEIKSQINGLISFIGAYSNSFCVGDKVFLDGKLVQINNDGMLTYGIELSPWNTQRTFSANLLG